MLRFVLIALVFCALSSAAQPNNGGPTPVEQAPLDGGLALLAAGGVAYGIRRLRRRQA